MNDMELADEIEVLVKERAVWADVGLEPAQWHQIIAALRRGPEPSVPEGEQLWLIERTYAKGAPAERREFWLGGTTDMHNDSFYHVGDPVWTTDALKAARFPSRAIAETLRYRHFHPESTAEVCGHMFQCGISPERPPSGEMVAEFMPCEAQPNPEPKMVVPIATLDRIMRDCEHGSRIWKECDALLRAYRLAAAEAEVRKPCPLCGRTEPHSHTSGPLGMS